MNEISPLGNSQASEEVESILQPHNIEAEQALLGMDAEGVDCECMVCVCVGEHLDASLPGSEPDAWGCACHHFVAGVA